MVEANIEIRASNGLHTRPAAMFVKTAKNYQSDVIVICGAQSANGKSLFKLQTLGLAQGSTITIRATGSDEALAVAALSQLVDSIKD